MYIERQISYLHSQVSLAAYELHKPRVRNNFRRGTVKCMPGLGSDSRVSEGITLLR